MSSIARLVVLATALTSLFAVMSSTAGAVTWTNTGATDFHATGAGAALHVGSNQLACSGATGSGTAPMDFTGSVLVISGTVTLSPCTLAGQSTYIHCGYTLTGATFASGVMSGVEDVTCVARLTATNTALCHIEGTEPFHYFNPSPGLNLPGRITVTTSQTVSVTHSSGTSCLLGTGTGHITHKLYTLTSVAGSPIITRDS